MKKVLYLFLLLPFLWQCGGSGNFFEPADLGEGIVSEQPTGKKWSIHSVFNASDLEKGAGVLVTYSAPTKAYLTEEGYVFYGEIADDRDTVAGGTGHTRDTWILLEIRDVGGEIKINSAYTSKVALSAPLDLYNARTELPTVLKENSPSSGNISIGLWPKYSRLTHENLATTNTSRFNYINSLQSGLYTNIVPEGIYSLLVDGSSAIGSKINSSTSIANLKTIVSGKVWNSVGYPNSLTPVGGSATNYTFNINSALVATTNTVSSSISDYYGWDIWTFKGFTATDGAVTEHYLFTYRALTLALFKNATTTTPPPPTMGEQLDLLKFVFADAIPPVGTISINNVYGDLIRLSIAP